MDSNERITEMLQKTIFPLVLVMCALSMDTDADPWAVSIDAGLTLTQNAYSDNWAGGENGSANWMFLSNSLAEKQIRPWLNNKNVLKLQFGQNYTQDNDSKNWGKPKKSNDLIDFESVFRFSMGSWADPFASGRIETQFIDKSDPNKGVIINPITVTESLGAAKVLTKEEFRDWTIRFGGGLREHIDREALDPVSGKRETETSMDGGVEFVNDLRTPLAGGRIKLQSKLIVFQALFYTKADEFEGMVNENY